MWVGKMPRAKKVKTPPPEPIAHTGEIPRWVFQDANGENFRAFEWEFAQRWEELYPDIDLETQYLFAPPRKFRLDFAHLPSKTGVEIQGGTFTNHMGHSSITGRQNDNDKGLVAGVHGWEIVAIPTHNASDLEAHEAVWRTIQKRLETMKTEEQLTA